MTWCAAAMAQSIERQMIGATGFSMQTAVNGMDCTVGEPMIAYTTTSDNILSQGFMQPDMDGTIQVSSEELDFLLVFPNPAHDHFVLQSGEVITHMEVFDSSGRLVWSMDPHARVVDVNADALAHGLYLLRITTSAQVLIRNIQIL